MSISDRAWTPEEKREVVERLLDAWLAWPDLRLGQLLVNATNKPDLFYVEDREMVRDVEAFAKGR